MNSPCNIEDIRREIAGTPQSWRQVEIQILNSGNEAESTKITLPAERLPLVAFRYKLLTSNWSNINRHQCFLNDSVFFHIDKKEAVTLQHQLNRLNPRRQESLKTTTAEEFCNLYENRNRREIKVKNFPGKLLYLKSPESYLDDGDCLSLEFMLEDDSNQTP